MATVSKDSIIDLLNELLDKRMQETEYIVGSNAYKITRRCLKLKMYNTLFCSQRGPHKKSCPTVESISMSKVWDLFNCVCFSLRHHHYYDDASKLEEYFDALFPEHRETHPDLSALMHFFLLMTPSICEREKPIMGQLKSPPFINRHICLPEGPLIYGDTRKANLPNFTLFPLEVFTSMNRALKMKDMPSQMKMSINFLCNNGFAPFNGKNFFTSSLPPDVIENGPKPTFLGATLPTIDSGRGTSLSKTTTTSRTGFRIDLPDISYSGQTFPLVEKVSGVDERQIDKKKLCVSVDEDFIDTDQHSISECHECLLYGCEFHDHHDKAPCCSVVKFPPDYLDEAMHYVINNKPFRFTWECRGRPRYAELPYITESGLACINWLLRNYKHRLTAPSPPPDSRESPSTERHEVSVSYQSSSGCPVSDSLVVICAVCKIRLPPNLTDDSWASSHCVCHLPALNMSEEELWNDILYMLIGIQSNTFIYDGDLAQFCIRNDVNLVLTTLSPMALRSFLSRHVLVGSHYRRLMQLASERANTSNSLYLNKIGQVDSGFSWALTQLLELHRSVIGECLINGKKKGLMRLSNQLVDQQRKINYIAEVCKVNLTRNEISGGRLTKSNQRNQNAQMMEADRSLPRGLKLISYLYQMTEDCIGGPLYPSMLFLLKETCKPFFRLLEDWAFRGVSNDDYEEFLIKINPDYLTAKDKTYWTSAYELSEAVHRDKASFPLFDVSETREVFRCGKTLNLLRLIVPKHHLLYNTRQLYPSLKFTLYPEEILEAEEACRNYRNQIRQIAWQNQTTRQQQTLKEELAKRDLIRRAKEATANELEKYNSQMAALREATMKRKREELEDLKRQVEESQKRRKDKEEAEKEEDRDLLRELANKESELKQFDAETERKVREDLVAYYSSLSLDAAYRELRANWRIQRHLLDDKRREYYHIENAKWDQEWQRYLEDGGPEYTVSDSGSIGCSSRFLYSSDTPDLSKPEEFEEEFDAIFESSSVENTEFEEEYCTLTQFEEVPDTDTTTPNIDINVNLEVPTDSRMTWTVPSRVKIEVEADESKLECINVAAPCNEEDVEAYCTLPCAVNEFNIDFDTNNSALDDLTGKQINNSALGKGDAPMPSKFRKQWEKPHKVSYQGDASMSTTLDYSERKSRFKEQNKYGHSSDVSVQEDVDASKLSRFKDQNKHGHSSKTTYESNMEDESLRLSRFQESNKHGHSSDSSAGSIIYPDMSSSHVHRTPDKALSSQFTRPIKQGALTSSIEKLLYHGQFGRSFNRKESMPAIPELDFQDDEMLNILKPLEGSESNAPLYDLKLDQLRAPIDMFPYLPGKYCRKTPDCEISDLNDDSKVEAMYSMSLEVIIDKLVKKPLRTQIRLVNESIINHFIVDLQLNKEFASLRQFLFLEDGEFARTFLTALFVKVTDPQHLCEVVNASFLTNTLNAAIESSLNPTFISERLSLNLVRFPEFQDLVETVSFDFLQFHYKVHWPVNIILTKKAIQMYNKVLTFLIQIKYAAWALTEIYYKLRRDGRVESGREKELHCLELYRHEMNHFVRSLESYICHQVCQVTWSELQADLSSPINHLDHLKEIHSQYLTRAMYRCLISHKMARVQQVIVNLLKEVHNFRRSLSFHLWPADASQPHPGWKQMQMSMQKFREYARFLYKLVCEMVKRGDHQRGHLHELKMRLNMNGYFDRM